MDKKIETKGLCYKCEELVTKKSAKNHINKCFGIDEKNANAFLVKVCWPHKNPIYWLYLSVPFKSTLEELDTLLRETWLECCGHLSQFTINNKRFSSEGEDDIDSMDSPYDEASTFVAVEKVLTVGLKFTHEYDFGSTTELLLEVVDLIKTSTSKKIMIIMQNQEPEFKCACEQKATMICPVEGDYLCESCANTDDDEESFLLPLVNSPRTGVCGYM